MNWIFMVVEKDYLEKSFSKKKILNFFTTDSKISILIFQNKEFDIWQPLTF